VSFVHFVLLGSWESLIRQRFVSGPKQMIHIGGLSYFRGSANPIFSDKIVSRKKSLNYSRARI
jgi:hypothetical protein